MEQGSWHSNQAAEPIYHEEVGHFYEQRVAESDLPLRIYSIATITSESDLFQSSDEVSDAMRVH